MATVLGLLIDWFGHDCFRITSGNKTIYIDPFNVSNASKKADFIFVTHEHFDHCSLDDIKKIATIETTIITIPQCQSKISKLNFKKFVLVEPNKTYSVEGLNFQTIPAYNTDKFRSPNISFHPKNDGHVGFVISIDGKTIYHSGDTDATPEMLALKNIDVAMVPVSGTYTMTAKEAADAINTFLPKLAIPMHYGSIVGTINDAQNFKHQSKVNVEILKKTNE